MQFDRLPFISCIGLQHFMSDSVPFNFENISKDLNQFGYLID